MQALFVHGLGRSPISGWPMLRRLKKQGIMPHSFFYFAAFESVPSIEARLTKKISQIAEQGDYVLIGHSLGGVLIRSALASLPVGTRMPSHVFVMGSPVRPSRIAQFLKRNWVFWLATRDCGQLLSSEDRMKKVAPSPVRTTSFVGTRGLYGWFSPFGHEPNDGIVCASEIAAEWITEEIQIPIVHTYMPSNRRISELVIERVLDKPKPSVEMKSST